MSTKPNNPRVVEICKQLNGAFGTYTFPNVMYHADIALASATDNPNVNNGFVLSGLGFTDKPYSKNNVDSEYEGVRAFITFVPRVNIATNESYNILDMLVGGSLVNKYRLNDAIKQSTGVITEDIYDDEDQLDDERDEPDNEKFDFFMHSADSLKPKSPDVKYVGSPLSGLGRSPLERTGDGMIKNAILLNPNTGRYERIQADNLQLLKSKVNHTIKTKFGPQYSNLYRMYLNKNMKLLVYEYTGDSGIKFNGQTIEVDDGLFWELFKFVPRKNMQPDIADDIKNEEISIGMERAKKSGAKKRGRVKPEPVTLRTAVLDIYSDLPVPIINKELFVKCRYYVVGNYDGSSISVADDGSTTGAKYTIKLVGKTVQVASSLGSLSSSPEFVLWRSDNKPSNEIGLNKAIQTLLKNSMPSRTSVLSIYSETLYLNDKLVNASSEKTLEASIRGQRAEEFKRTNMEYIKKIAIAHKFLRPGDNIDGQKVVSFINNLMLMKAYVNRYGIPNQAIPGL